MKKLTVFFAAICIAVAAQAQDTCRVLQIHNQAAITHIIKLADVDSISFRQGIFHNGHEYVDLGLPSGILWATCNVGAILPEQYGDYFAWAETAPKAEYSWATYAWANGSANKLTKYNTSSDYGTVVDNILTLETADDAAIVLWGGKWRMPTSAEFDELTSECTKKWMLDYNGTGINGYLLTGPNGNTIFFPATNRVSSVGVGGYYWSTSLVEKLPSSARAFGFQGSYTSPRTTNSNRYLGYSIRPIYVPTE